MSERTRNIVVLSLVLALIAGSIAVIATKETKLGLDLQGGVSLVYEGKGTRQQPTVTPEALDRAVDIIRERVDSLGVAEPEISRSGAEQIVVDLPAVENAERAADRVGTTAQMVFYDWEKNLLDADCNLNPDINYMSPQGTTSITTLFQAVERASKCEPFDSERRTSASDARFYGFDRVNKPLNDGLPAASEEELWESQPGGVKPEGAKAIEVPQGILIVQAEEPDGGGPRPDQWWLIHDDPGLLGEDIESPEQAQDQQTNEPIVTMEFSDKGKRDFQQVTRDIAQRGSDNSSPGINPAEQSQHFAIVLDNQLVSVPFINYRENPDGIDGETGAQISGSFTIQSAQDLAEFLKIGALPIELELISRSQVSSTLGDQALDEGIVAGIAGFVIVALFLIIFYRILGVIAVVALAVYALYFFAVIKLIPIVLTLPGIAGLILTLGVAADANIVIFERVKEEVRKGRSTGAAIAEGYKKGISTIIDANVVTFLVAFILFILATAGIKGFAFTLGVGTGLSLLTAVLATQAILLTLRQRKILQRPSALGASATKERFRYDYMGVSRYFFAVSGVILLICALGLGGKGLTFGIDFESGTRITASLEQAASVDQVRSAIEDAGYGEVEIQTVDNPDLGDNVLQISSGELSTNEVGQVESLLENQFGTSQFSDDTIGPTFGKTIANAAIVAIIASLIVISIYLSLRFGWKFSVPVLIAIMHDILITGGVYALVGREVTASTVAALLTVLGFSLYDTIIVFDRIRENTPRMPNAAFSQITNRSMSEVLMRSLATSFCTLLPILALLFFGGETLKDFAFALAVGVASGTYSSVFIAGPVLSLWKEREPIYQARVKRITAEHGHVPPYAVASAGAPIDVAPKQRRRAAVTSDPSQGVGQEEFDAMVADLGIESAAPAPSPARSGGGSAATPSAPRPGGRRARSKAQAQSPQTERPADDDDGADAGESAAKKNRNKHGRPR